MKNNDIVTFEIAKLAKEQGLKQGELAHYYSIEGTLEHEEMSIAINYCDAPTYHQLIDWIFEQNNKVDCFVFVEQAPKKEIEIQRGWLKIWYDTLKNCPLKGEFKDRLLIWFRCNGYELNNLGNHVNIHTNGKSLALIEDDILVDSLDLVINNELKLITFKTYHEAQHQGILELFKHIIIVYNE
jgi:hypothetical protein